MNAAAQKKEGIGGYMPLKVIRLGVLAITGFGTTGVHETAFLQEADFGCANSGELQIKLAKNLTNGPTRGRGER